MAIKYEIKSIENVGGQGRSRKYVHLQQGEALSADALERRIEEACSVTRADVKAVMAELAHLAMSELAQGRRFYVPELGYLSLQAAGKPVEQKDGKKLTGRDIYVRGINFLPERRLLSGVRKQASFEKAGHTARSKQYEADGLWKLMEDYLDKNIFLTTTRMREEFKLSDYMARQWLSRFCAEGKLVKRGLGQKIYYRAGKE